MLKSLFIGLIILSAFTSRGMLFLPGGMLPIHLHIADGESRQDGYKPAAFGLQNSDAGTLPDNVPVFHAVKTFAHLKPSALSSRGIRYKFHFETSCLNEKAETGGASTEYNRICGTGGELEPDDRKELAASGLSPPRHM